MKIFLLALFSFLPVQQTVGAQGHSSVCRSSHTHAFMATSRGRPLHCNNTIACWMLIPQSHVQHVLVCIGEGMQKKQLCTWLTFFWKIPCMQYLKGGGYICAYASFMYIQALFWKIQVLVMTAYTEITMFSLVCWDESSVGYSLQIVI